MACGGGALRELLRCLLAWRLVRHGACVRGSTTTTARPKSINCTVTWTVRGVNATMHFGVAACRSQCLVTNADHGPDRMFSGRFQAWTPDGGWLHCQHGDSHFELPPPVPTDEDGRQRRCWEAYMVSFTDVPTGGGGSVTLVHHPKDHSRNKFLYECAQDPCTSPTGAKADCPTESHLPSILAGRPTAEEVMIGRMMLNHLDRRAVSARDKAQLAQMPRHDVERAVLAYLRDAEGNKLTAMEVHNYLQYVLLVPEASVDDHLEMAGQGHRRSVDLAGFQEVVEAMAAHKPKHPWKGC